MMSVWHNRSTEATSFCFQPKAIISKRSRNKNPSAIQVIILIKFTDINDFGIIIGATKLLDLDCLLAALLNGLLSPS